jgi:ATP-binding cassette subfamily B protein
MNPSLAKPRRLPGLLLLMRTCWRAGRLRTVGSAGLLVVTNSRYILGFYGAKLVVDGALLSATTTVVQGALIIAVVAASGQVAEWWGQTIQTGLRERTAMAFEAELIRLSSGVPGIGQFEEPEVADKMEQLWEARWAMGDSVNAVLHLLQVVARLVLTGILLADLHPALLLVGVAGIAPVVASLRRHGITWRAEEETAQDYRLTLHLRDLVKDHRAAAELRLHCLGPLVMRRHSDAHARLLARIEPVRLRAAMLDIFGDLLFSTVKVGAMGGAALLASSGRISVGSAVLAIGLTHQIGGQVSDLDTGIGWGMWALRRVGHLVWLIHESDAAHEAVAVTDPARVPDRLRQGIVLQDVSFTYPGTTTAALSGINLNLPAGSTVALVGENGAGKTTLVKLLCRFYEPSEGQITVDGVALNRIPVELWRSRISGAFQEPSPFDLVAREAIGVGDLRAIADQTRIAEAVEDAGATTTIAQLPVGLDTPLGPTFDDGAELSGGQWQQVALARALMRRHPLLLVLDEPTAALDPGREHALFERYAAAAGRASATSGGITVLVSHRFSTVRVADLIVVVDSGGLLEAGTHEELMNTSGPYAELYGIQARAYR